MASFLKAAAGRAKKNPTFNTDSKLCCPQFLFKEHAAYESQIAGMKLSLPAGLLSLLASSFCSAESNLTTAKSSQQLLQGDFRPPQVFKNLNIVRNTNLDRGYVRETINVVVENLSKEPQSEYYLPFGYDVVAKVGGMEVRDKKNTEKGGFDVRIAAVGATLGEDGIATR